MRVNCEYPKEAGVYKFTRIDNGKMYIGKSVNLRDRLNDHKNLKIGSCYFEHALIKHGWSAFSVEILYVFENFDKTKDNDALLNIETDYIDLFDSTNREKGYNICRSSNDGTGIPLSEEHKEKIRQSSLGRTFSDETRKKLSKSKLGKTLSEETKSKMSKSKIGKPSPRLGELLSKETKDKISKSRSGQPSNRLGVKLSEETKEKMRQAKKNKSKSR